MATSDEHAGWVYLVGAGPGDPDLLTIKAQRLLGRADVVLHDSLIDPRTLALCKPGAKLVDVGKRSGKRSTKQTEINAILCAEARTGQKIIRLKGGDPMIFGRAAEEIEALAAIGITAQIVPGITTATAVAAALGTSLTKRGVARAVHFLTGHGADGGLPPQDWVALVRAGGTIAIYMGSQSLPGLATHLIEAGMDPTTPAIAMESATWAEQRTIRATIGTLPRLAAPFRSAGPCLFLIGEALRTTQAHTTISQADQGTLSPETPARA
ncbi:MAG: uroporphyrinogen-III C-methyltransferase [Rhodospirillales bacterium 20-60-12]|nr:MAG: uroporphyrinogen-III C-methyltransferase [Rhodospirillales bacterium 20-60-12]HQT66118.1 uroporphyrinogen-III C-methyltransferase [Acetobacteraceae bacterium]